MSRSTNLLAATLNLTRNEKMKNVLRGALLFGTTHALCGVAGGFADHQFGFDHNLATL